MRVFRNGSEDTSFVFDDHQLEALSLGIAAADGEIGMGTIVVPGDATWRSGDRITIKEGFELLYTGYVGDWGVSRNPAHAGALETTYQLMDLNRQLIGRKVTEWTRATEYDTDRLTQFLADKMSDLTFITTYKDSSGSVMLPPKTYTGDGLMDLGADLIKFVGKTFFIVPSQTENSFQFHYHLLTSGGVTAGFSVTDVRADINGTTYLGLSNPHRGMSAADLKNDVEVRNGLDTASGDNPTSITTHGAGGLKWQAVLDYENDQSALSAFATNILNTQGDERPTYSFSVNHMNGAQAKSIPAGSIISVTSTVLGLTASAIRVAHLTLTISRDENGKPLPGYWDAAVEGSYPVRLPTSAVGLGLTGGDSGRLSDPLQVDHVTVNVDDPYVAVGSTTSVTGQLMTDKEVGVAIENQTVTWTLKQYKDDALSVAGSAYTRSPATSTTDISGMATTVVTHATDDGTIVWWMEASA